MSTVSISSAVLTNLGRDNVFLTTANIGYSCSATFVKTADSSSTYSKTEYTDGTLSYEWTINGASFSGASGTAALTGLTPKAINNISGSVTVKCTETISTYSRTDVYGDPEPIYGEPEEEGEDPPIVGWGEAPWIGYSNWVLINSTSSVTGTATQATASLPVYTRPGTFSDFSFSVDTIIESAQGLTAAKVSNWITHCNAFNSWYNQSANTSANSCAVTTGDYITATWYNSCVSAIADSTVRPSTVTGGANGTIITASVINALGTAITKN